MNIAFDRPSPVRRMLPMFLGFDGWLALAVLLLCGAGLTIMYSAGFDHGTRFVDQARNMLLAFGVLFIVAQISPQRLQSMAVPLYVIGVALLLGVEFMGVTRKGATRWLNVGVTVIQPSELMKIAMPLMLAWWFQKREGQLRPFDFLVAGALLVVPVGLIVLQPDLGTALLVMASGLFVIFFAGLSWRLIMPVLLAGAIGITAIIIAEPYICVPGVDWVVLHDYQKGRVCTLLDPSRTRSARASTSSRA